MFGWFRAKKQAVKLTLKPLHGIGADKKAALKFVKKYFKKAANYQQIVDDITAASKTDGCMLIYAEVKAKVAKRIDKQADKLSIEVDFLNDEVLEGAVNKKVRNKIEMFRKQKQDFILSYY